MCGLGFREPVIGGCRDIRVYVMCRYRVIVEESRV